MTSPTSATPSFHGVIPPVLTPFNEDFQVDTDTLRKLVDHLIDGGVDGLFALGSSAETVFLTRENRQKVVRTIVEHTAGRVPVIVGVIDATLPVVAEHVADAVAAGAQGLVATAPYYVRTNGAEIEAHFRAIHELAPQLPLFAYNIPVCVHNVLEVGMLIRLASEGVLAGLKDSGGVDSYTRNVILARNAAGLKDSFTVLTGSETTVDFAYLAGADGVVPGLGNVDPQGYAQLHAALRAGDYPKAREIQERIIALFEIVFQGDGARMGGSSAGLGAFKAALKHLGVFPNGLMHPPHTPLNEQEIAAINAIVDAAELPRA